MGGNLCSSRTCSPKWHERATSASVPSRRGGVVCAVAMAANEPPRTGPWEGVICRTECWRWARDGAARMVGGEGMGWVGMFWADRDQHDRVVRVCEP